jgi:hypothetical protein
MKYKIVGGQHTAVFGLAMVVRFVRASTVDELFSENAPVFEGYESSSFVPGVLSNLPQFPLTFQCYRSRFLHPPIDSQYSIPATQDFLANLSARCRQILNSAELVFSSVMDV